MKIRIHSAIALLCLTAIFALAQNAGLEGTWVTEGVAAVEAAKKANKSINGLAEGTRIKFKVDTKKNKVSGTITQLNTDKEYTIEDGKLADKTFTFKSVENVSIGFGNQGFNNRGGGGGQPSTTPAPTAISWQGEITDGNTVTLTQLSATGEPTNAKLVLHRASK